MTRHVVTWLAAGAVVLLGALLTQFTGPRTPRLSTAVSGDAELAGRVREAIDDDRGYRSLLVGEITADGVRYAGIGAMSPGGTPQWDRPLAPSDPIELGSITKTFNGMLFADAIGRGEVSPDDQLQTYLPELSGSVIGAVTLAELASHRAAVPPLPPSTLGRAVLASFTNGNPYASDTRETVLAQVRAMPLMGERGKVVYSNLGATLLGWALAQATGQKEWTDYACERLLSPLSMTHTVFAPTVAEVPAGAVPGWTDNGRPASKWVSPAFRPAGSSTWSTAEDVVRYAQAVLRGTAPGMAALQPRFDADAVAPGATTRIGYHWFTTTIGEHAFTWHNGGTAGFRTILAIDQDAGRAVLVIGNTSRGVDPIAVRLLTGQTEGMGDTGGVPPIIALVLGAVGLIGIGRLVHRALRATSRVQLISSTAGAVTGLALTRALGPWGYLPGWLWGGLLGVAVVAMLLAAHAGRSLPWRTRRWRILHEVTTGLAVAVAIAAVTFIR